MPILAHFYDIESVTNVFTLANFMPEGPHIDLYYLCDDPALISEPDFYQKVVDRIHEKNKNFQGTVSLFDLSTEFANHRLAKEFGLSNATYTNNPAAKSDYPQEFRLVCDTDKGYSDEVYPYLMGYNSYNYDTTMLTLYLHTVFQFKQTPLDARNPQGASTATDMFFSPTTALLMREYNNHLFSSRFKKNMPEFLTVKNRGHDPKGSFQWSPPDYRDDRYLIRKNMMMSGRHVDVARLNEKASHMGLKRLIGMLGGQILESDKLRPGQDKIENPDQLYDLFAYNVSDVVNLKLILFDHTVYQGNFSLKKGLLKDYPELIYDRFSEDTYKPVIDPHYVRRDRLFVDSSSAQLATKALCPYGHLKDIPKVDFLYPSEKKAKELGIPQRDILDLTRDFFMSKFPQPEIRAQFDRIYKFYAEKVRGHNFNQSKNFESDYQGYPEDKVPVAENSANLPNDNLCIPYFNADGTPSSCYAQFSIGGIHGAEYNKALYEFDILQARQEAYRLSEVMRLFPDPVELKRAKHVEIMETDGTVTRYPAGRFLKNGSTLKAAWYKDPPALPEMFTLQSGSIKLTKAYTWTSADPTNHEDFTSYYPNLLCMMSAFWNDGLGYDRYAEIFDQKERLGKQMKDKEHYSDAEIATFAVQREGTKLVLNSASGAADATFESNIRMNNNIIKMRIIGQLFSYTIAQAQTYYGAKITSTNTDGLYSVMESERNNAILAQESANIGVAIEPEPTYLISKDTNNRIEVDPNTGIAQSASGGTLACQSWAGKKGPQPTKSLAHSAIIDWALCEYLIFVATGDQKRASLSSPFNAEIGLKILLSAANKMDKVRLLNMFQNVIASSPSSNTYHFATTHDKPDIPIVMQHYNRVFIMRDNTPNTLHLYAATLRKLTTQQMKTREKHNERAQQHDPTALYVLNINGVESKHIQEGYDAVVKKITDVDSKWFMRIENRDLHFIPENEVDEIIANLDYGKYLYLLAKAFDGGTIDGNGKKGTGAGWRNRPPHAAPAADIREFINDIDTAAARLNIQLPGRPTPAEILSNLGQSGNTQTVQITQTVQSVQPIDDDTAEDEQDGAEMGQIEDVDTQVTIPSDNENPAENGLETPDTQASATWPPDEELPWQQDVETQPVTVNVPQEQPAAPEQIPESSVQTTVTTPSQQTAIPQPVQPQAPTIPPIPAPPTTPTVSAAPTVPAPPATPATTTVPVAPTIPTIPATPATQPPTGSAPQYDPNDLSRLIKEKNAADVEEIRKTLRNNLSQCVKLITKLKSIPGNGLTPQYISELQKALQVTLERL